MIPGHGGALDRTGALQLLDEDAEYLRALAADAAAATLAPGPRSSTQRKIHAGTVAIATTNQS